MEPNTLLPDPSRFHLEYIACTSGVLTVVVSSIASCAVCPHCEQCCGRIHSHYQRTLADLPWNRVAVRLQVRARKFFCDNRACERVIFTEPLPGFAARYAHKTQRLDTALYLLGYALGGEAGARVAVGLGLSVSPDTLLCRVRQVGAAQAKEKTAVDVVGIDDWAFRKGRRYGTLLIDLQQHRVLDLLPERTAACLAEWLAAHPSVRILSRDRAGEYAQGARQGAPQAVQVADRWHLVKNLAETLERFLATQQALLKEAAPLLGESVPVVWPPSKGAPTEHKSQQSRTRRHERYTYIRQRQEQGASRRQIAAELGISQTTVMRDLRAEEFPERARNAPRPTSLDPFKAYLQQRWQEGCHRASQLYHEIKEQGFTGSQSWSNRYVSGLHKAAEQPPQARAPAPRQVASLLLGKEDKLSAEQKAFVKALCHKSTAIQTVWELTQHFLDMVRQRQGEQLGDWMHKAQESGIDALRGFVAKLKQDLAAVTNGLTLEWSNGQTEGQVNRLKLIKRSMYGRAKFDLLQARVLPMAQIA